MNIILGDLFGRLKKKLSKQDLFDLFVALDEQDEILYEFLGKEAQKNFPDKF